MRMAGTDDKPWRQKLVADPAPVFSVRKVHRRRKAYRAALVKDVRTTSGACGGKSPSSSSASSSRTRMPSLSRGSHLLVLEAQGHQATGLRCCFEAPATRGKNRSPPMYRQVNVRILQFATMLSRQWCAQVRKTSRLAVSETSKTKMPSFRSALLIPAHNALSFLMRLKMAVLLGKAMSVGGTLDFHLLAKTDNKPRSRGPRAARVALFGLESRNVDTRPMRVWTTACLAKWSWPTVRLAARPASPVGRGFPQPSREETAFRGSSTVAQ